MISEPFAEGTSVLHRADPAVKIVSALVLAFSLATTGSQLVATAGIMTGLGLATLARLPVRPLVRRLIAVNLFLILIWLTLPMTGTSPPIWQWGWLTIHGEGLRLAGLITLKANGIYLLLTALTATASVADTGRALERLGLPNKLILLLLTTYRYLGRIEQEYQRLRRSAAMRCFSATTSLHTYRTYGYLIGMTLIRSHERSRRVHQAMLLRGFTGRFPLLTEQKTRPADYALLILSLTLALAFALYSCTHR